jgi:hypothetical protein
MDELAALLPPGLLVVADSALGHWKNLREVNLWCRSRFLRMTEYRFDAVEPDSSAQGGCGFALSGGAVVLVDQPAEHVDPSHRPPPTAYAARGVVMSYAGPRQVPVFAAQPLREGRHGAHGLGDEHHIAAAPTRCVGDCGTYARRRTCDQCGVRRYSMLLLLIEPARPARGTRFRRIRFPGERCVSRFLRQEFQGFID